MNKEILERLETQADEHNSYYVRGFIHTWLERSEEDIPKEMTDHQRKEWNQGVRECLEDVASLRHVAQMLGSPEPIYIYISKAAKVV